MLLEFYLAKVEKQFLEYRLRNTNFYSERASSLLVVSASLDLGSYAEIRDFIVSFEKILFRNFTLDNLGNGQKQLIDKYLDRYSTKLSFLDQLLNSYAAGYQENQIQAQFYKQLIGSLESIKDKTHPAFSNKEEFLDKKPISSVVPVAEGAVTDSDLKKVPKVKILKAPEKVIAAFEFLTQQDFCEIQNVPSFVYSAFAFPENYKIPELSYFTFRWKKNPSYHSLTVLMKDLYDKKSITCNKPALEGWLSVLLPLVTKGSIGKYLSSKGKEFSEKNRIDIQIFN